MRFSERVAVIAVCFGMIVPACAEPVPPPTREPKLIGAVERRFGDFFMFATDDGRTYDLYQSVQNQLGLPDHPDLTCMFHQCFLKVASVPVAQLSAAEGQLPAFREVQASYRLLRRAAPTERDAAIATWRKSLDHLRCAVTDTGC